MNTDDGLSPAARSALASLRADDDLPADARERVWARLAAAPVAAPSDMSRRTGSRGAGLVIGLALAAGVALALVNLGRGAQQVAVAPQGDAAAYDRHGAAGIRPVRVGEPPVRAAVAVIDLPAPVVVPLQVASPMSTSAREPARREAGLSDRAVRAETKPARALDPADASTLAAETALVQAAQAALAAGDPGTALARLDEHRRAHAGGVLARERDALRVTALCDAGRRADSRAAAEQFMRQHPGSMLAERVQGVCVTP
ncbi:MAG TPA: hypothetical protein VGB85_33970 [Nannocystis sp.]